MSRPRPPLAASRSCAACGRSTAQGITYCRPCLVHPTLRLLLPTVRAS
jgi:hypothetical protein